MNIALCEYNPSQGMRTINPKFSYPILQALVRFFVSPRSGALLDMINDKSFVAIAEAAVLKGLEPLQRACVAFASTSIWDPE